MVAAPGQARARDKLPEPRVWSGIITPHRSMSVRSHCDVGQPKTTPNLGLTLDLLPCRSPDSRFHAITLLKHILRRPQSLFRPETLLPELPEPNGKQQSFNRRLIRPLRRHATTGTFRPINDTLPQTTVALSASAPSQTCRLPAPSHGNNSPRSPPPAKPRPPHHPLPPKPKPRHKPFSACAAHTLRQGDQSSGGPTWSTMKGWGGKSPKVNPPTQLSRPKAS
jgi:hypothetical protein